jgi:hypothetical protein
MPRRLLPVSLLSLLVGLGATLACDRAPAPLPPLGNTFASLDDLGAEVVRRVAANDAAGLGSLALTETEFKAHVWPYLPVSRPERNVPFDYVWSQQQQRSQGFLAETMARHGGRAYAFLGLRFAGVASEYGPVKVHRDSVLHVRTPEGDETDVRLFGSALEHAGRFKVYSFVVD